MLSKEQSLRVAILPDIYGNLSAFDSVLADLHQVAPDLVFHGGSLADSGYCPIEVTDRICRICDLGWQGVMGNGDEMLDRQEGSLEDSANRFSRYAISDSCLLCAVFNATDTWKRTLHPATS